MQLFDSVKKSILETTVVRREIDDSSATKQYYNDLIKSLHIDNFPLLSIDTIEKRTYFVESNGKFFLVFDHYLLEVMDFLNRATADDVPTNIVELFFYRIFSEECYLHNKIPAAVEFISKHINGLEEIIAWYKEKASSRLPDILFIQQAFLIAHEVFHFYVHSNPSSRQTGITSKNQFLNRILVYTNDRDKLAAYAMKGAIKNPHMAEECLCDSTAVIQAIDVGTKLEKLDIVESGIAATLAILDQFTVSTIQDAVKFSGDILYERAQNLLNFRLLHMKAFTSLYIKKYGSPSDLECYQTQIEMYHEQWMKNVFGTLMKVLLENNDLLKDCKGTFTANPEELKTIRDFLKSVYRN